MLPVYTSEHLLKLSADSGALDTVLNIHTQRARFFLDRTFVVPLQFTTMSEVGKILNELFGVHLPEFQVNRYLSLYQYVLIDYEENDNDTVTMEEFANSFSVLCTGATFLDSVEFKELVRKQALRIFGE